MLTSWLGELRYLTHVRYLERITQAEIDLGLMLKTFKAIDKEFKDDKSWREGKLQFKTTLVLVISFLVTLSWII